MSISIKSKLKSLAVSYRKSCETLAKEFHTNIKTLLLQEENSNKKSVGRPKKNKKIVSKVIIKGKK